MKKLLFSALAVVALLYAGGTVFADSTGLSISPPIIEGKANPGDIFNSALKIKNLEDVTNTYYFLKRDMSGLDESGNPIFAIVGEKTGYEISEWISVDSPSVTVEAGQTKEVKFSVTVPKNATPGSHFGGIFLSLNPPTDVQQGSAIGYEVGSIISLQISGNVIEEARIREFSTDRTIYSVPKVNFLTRIDNLGNAVVRPRGSIEITDMFGKKVATFTVNQPGGAILPQANREFKNEWLGEGLHIGRYQALMGIAYGSGVRKTITSVTTFWVLPLNIILPVIGGLIVLILIISITTKLYIRNQLKKYSKGKSGATPSGTSISRLLTTTIVILTLIFALLIVLFVFFA